MPDERRLFNAGEKSVLFIAADGKCESCGTELAEGWHADHIIPHSKDGPTRVGNGAALCGPCNLAKSDSMKGGTELIELRQWQVEAAEIALRQETALIEACPGAGKTIFAGYVIRKRLDRGEIDRVIIVVPSSELRIQWGESLSKYSGIEVVYSANNRQILQRSKSTDFQGFVTTYQAVAENPQLWEYITSRGKTMVVFDEIHRAGEGVDLRWGKALKEAFAAALVKLMLSGTPFRSDNNRIPWVQYGEDGVAEPAYRYVYLRAVKDGVVRPVRFDLFDGKTRWLDAVDHEVELAEATEKDEPRALATALSPDGSWIRSVLEHMDGVLTETRKIFAEAGFLLVAMDQSHADALAKVLQDINGEAPVLVHGNSDEAIGGIEKFRGGKQRWLVAVQMVSEGVDIKRLSGGVYATNKKTELIFRQIVHRAVRMNSPEDQVVAVWALPSIPTLQDLAVRLEKEANAAMKEDENALKSATDTDMERESPAPSTFVPLGASAADWSASVLSGDVYREELKVAQEYLANCPEVHMDVALLAKVLKANGVLNMSPMVAAVKEDLHVSVQEQHIKMRRAIGRRVNTVARQNDLEYPYVWRRLNDAVGERNIDMATTESLHRRLELFTIPGLPWLYE